jgi:hypothetical protein
MKEEMRHRFVPANYVRSLYDKLTNLKQGLKTVDAYFYEMEMIMQRAKVREPKDQTMQRFLAGLSFQIQRIVRHHPYADMCELLHQSREAEATVAEEARFAACSSSARGRFPSRSPYSGQNSGGVREASSVGDRTSTPVRPDVSNNKPSPAMSGSGSTSSTARNRDMSCHTCGGKGHFKRDCPNKKTMIVDAYGGYETGDDADPFEEEPVEVNEEIYYCDASPNPVFVCSPRVLQVSPSPDDQRCNLFQTRADVSEGRACKVIIDGGSCRNLASKELCTKLKLKYYPHPSPYFIQWLSDAGEMKVSHIVRVDF